MQHKMGAAFYRRLTQRQINESFPDVAVFCRPTALYSSKARCTRTDTCSYSAEHNSSGGSPTAAA